MRSIIVLQAFLGFYEVFGSIVISPYASELSRAVDIMSISTPGEQEATNKVLESVDRIKRDNKYHVKCKQSGTGLFSFFVVPILMGDIMIDFMNMIDVMVDIMATATGTGGNNNNNNNNNNNGGGGGGGGSGGGSGSGNNNNNNNNNGRKRKREVSKRQSKTEVLESALDSFLDTPSNSSMIHYYETTAKNHLDQYLQLLLHTNSHPEHDGIGPRKSKSTKKSKTPRQRIAREFATKIFANLLSSFHDFKRFCEGNESAADCSILDRDDLVLANAIKSYAVTLKKTDIFSP